jgi:hypothetical protein
VFGPLKAAYREQSNNYAEEMLIQLASSIHIYR